MAYKFEISGICFDEVCFLFTEKYNLFPEKVYIQLKKFLSSSVIILHLKYTFTIINEVVHLESKLYWLIFVIKR